MDKHLFSLLFPCRFPTQTLTCSRLVRLEQSHAVERHNCLLLTCLEGDLDPKVCLPGQQEPSSPAADKARDPAAAAQERGHIFHTVPIQACLGKISIGTMSEMSLIALWIFTCSMTVFLGVSERRWPELGYFPAALLAPNAWKQLRGKLQHSASLWAMQFILWSNYTRVMLPFASDNSVLVIATLGVSSLLWTPSPFITLMVAVCEQREDNRP